MNTITECDFCERWLDDEEDLHPIYVGEQPTPEPVRASAQKPEMGEMQTVGYGPENGNIQVLGRSVDEIAAILDAVEGSNEMQLNVYRSVFEQQRFDGKLGFEKGEVGNRVKGDIEFEENKSLISAEVVVRPEGADREADMEVCGYCKEEFKK